MMTTMSSTTTDQRGDRGGAAARILRYARRRARLTQRALASASGISQETIARIESGATQPRFDTLDRLLAASGFGLEITPRLGDGVDRTLIQESLQRTPAERLAAGQQAAQGMEWLQSAVRRSAAPR
jgi:transcriptional regulator with XRE-family HTH domain